MSIKIPQSFNRDFKYMGEWVPTMKKEEKPNLDLDERLAPIKTAHVVDVLSNMRKSAQNEADEYFAGERGRALDRIKTIEDIAKKLRINLKEE